MFPYLDRPIENGCQHYTAGDENREDPHEIKVSEVVSSAILISCRQYTRMSTKTLGKKQLVDALRLDGKAMGLHWPD